jgi:hypothetical protein
MARPQCDTPLVIVVGQSLGIFLYFVASVGLKEPIDGLNKWFMYLQLHVMFVMCFLLNVVDTNSA